MRLDLLCDVTWSYDLIRSGEPSDRSDGLLFGGGEATFTGSLAGHALWSNFPRLRGNYAFPTPTGSSTSARADRCCSRSRACRR